MSSMMAVLLGASFSAGLLLGMWAEENQKRSPRAVDGTARWVPAALGVLRAEVFVLQGLLILLVVRPVSWPPLAVLVLAGVIAGVAKAVLPGSEHVWWSPLVEGPLLVAWSTVTAIWMPVPYPVGVRIELMLVACCIFGLARVLVETLPGTGAGDDRPASPSEYVAVSEDPSRA